MSDGTDPDDDRGGTDEDEGVLEAEDTLVDRGVDDVLDEGWSPPERPWAGDGWGTTAREEAMGEPLEGRLRRELPDRADDGDGDGLGDVSDTDGELLDREVGDVRAGRLASGPDDSTATDVGIDGGAASSEEAAVHLVPDEETDGSGDDGSGDDGTGDDAAARFLRNR